MGDCTEYLSETKKSVCNGVVVVRSLQWPGSFNFYFQGRYLNIYVGNGLKYEETSYFPIHPPIVKADREEYPLQPEPTPLEEPEAKKEDAEGEDGGEAEEDDE